MFEFYHNVHKMSKEVQFLKILVPLETLGVFLSFCKMLHFYYIFITLILHVFFRLAPIPPTPRFPSLNSFSMSLIVIYFR